MSSGAENGRADMTKLISVSSNFANGRKKEQIHFFEPDIENTTVIYINVLQPCAQNSRFT